MKNKRSLSKYRGTVCLNCGQPLDKSEIYCHFCSQLNSTKRLAFDDFFNEFFAGIFAYDSRLYRTLRALLFNPGKISKDYIEGKRQRYANPYRFFLSVAIIFFLVWGGFSSFSSGAPNMADLELDSSMEVDSVISSQGQKIPEQFEFIFPKGGKTLEGAYAPQSQLDTMRFWPATVKKWNVFHQYYQDSNNANPTEALEELNYDLTFYNKWMYKKVVDVKTFLSNPELFLHAFIGKLPFIIFFFLPVFALFIWLLYARNPFTYMEHLIFTFHNQTLWFVLYGLALILDEIFSTGMISGFAVFLFLFYLYKAMRKFYGQNRVKTLLKFFILTGIFLILAIIGAFFSFIASFAIY